MPPNGCSTTELIDLANRHRPTFPKSIKNTPLERKTIEFFDLAGLRFEKTLRFCAEVSQFGTISKSLFKLVFKNPTFRVYKLL